MNAIDKQSPAQVTVIGTSKILTALHSVMSSCGYVQKKGRNDFQKYNYAGEGNLLEVLRPAMIEAGLLLIPSGKSKSPVDEHGITHVEVEYTLAHKDGEVWPEKIVAYGDGGDKNSKGVGDKGLYKALTGANKYLLFKLFQIETGDDPEKDSAHEQDGPRGAQTSEIDKEKNPPGRSKAVTDVRAAAREMHACDDAASLLAYINTDDFKAFAFKVCCQFPKDWIGPEDNSGLSGVLAERGVQLKCQDLTDAYIHKMERARDEKLKPKQAAE